METSPQITLHEYQVKAWLSKKRFIFLCAGVQSGKTTFGAVWILNEAMHRGPGDYIILAPTYKVLQQSTLVKFFEMCPKGYGEYNKADSTYKTVDNRTFYLRSADIPESIEGITAKGIWADEASIMKADAWLMMQGRVSRTLGRICCTFTPIALNWVHKEIEKDRDNERRGKGSDIEFIQFRSIDSPYFPKEEYERAKRMLTETQFKLRYEGIFGKAEGLIYPDFNNNDHVVEDFLIPDDWQRIGGVDFGYNNPFVGLKGAVNGDDVLFIYGEKYQNRTTLADHIEYLGSEICYYADPSGAQEIAELHKLGIWVRDANNDVMLGIQKVTERIRTGRLKVFKSCYHLIDEFAVYRYQKPTGGEVVKDKPLKVDDHCMDSLRYLCMGLDMSMRPGIIVI